MSQSAEALSASSELNLWYKVRGGEDLKLSDIPEIIPLRWTYFKQNWEFIKKSILDNASSYGDPDFLNDQIKQFSDFIASQRNAPTKINPFSDGSILHRYYAIFDSISVTSIPLTVEEENIIDARKREVQAFSKNDFLRIKKRLIDYRDSIADISNLKDDTYNSVYKRSSIASQFNATTVDLNLMLSMQENIASVDFLLANLFNVDAVLDPFALARANANNPEVNIGQYNSGRLVKLNYGEDLQSLANRYLGSADSWIDIAIANGLKAPYIDEVGEKISLLSNAQSNQINLAATDINGNLNIDKFYINQVVVLQSNVENFPEQRSIVNIRQIPISNEIILELDGDPDLNRYKIADQAHIRVFKPNTTNSSFYILIPSSEPLDNTRQNEVPWFLAKSQADEKKAGIDLYIDENGDINFNNNGDLELSYGLENAVQAVKLKLVTELGSLRYHPEYGLVNVSGTNNSDIDSIKAQIIESLVQQIEADSRFSNIETLDVRYLTRQNDPNMATSFGISMSVKMAGSDTVIPITFSIYK